MDDGSFIAIKRNIAFKTVFLYVIVARLYFKNYSSKCKSGISCVYLSVTLGIELRKITISKITFLGSGYSTVFIYPFNSLLVTTYFFLSFLK